MQSVRGKVTPDPEVVREVKTNKGLKHEKMLKRQVV